MAAALVGSGVRAEELIEGPAILPGHYSTGQQGSKLKWLPYRPQHGAVVRASATEPILLPALAAPLQLAQQKLPGAFDDPFGDRVPAEPADPAEPGADGDVQPQFTDPLFSEPAMPLPGAAPGQLPDAATEQPPRELPAEPSAEPTPARRPYVEPQRTDSKVPSLNQQFAMGRNEVLDECLSPKELKPIKELTTDIQAEQGDFPKECPLGEEEAFQPRAWAPTTYTWKASGLCHKPLYFEDVQLERYGHSWGPFLQPVISGAHFFLTVPALPYLMGVELPDECMYSLGYYRPGSCAPYMLDPLPLSVRGALFEAGAWVGGVAIIP